ncbi:MAG: lipid IV(A) 3-deoxy-D-manno-octulosonic acid transferase [Gammaproteobacteria bacterium]|nr:lipid IV(A) 3-deoxy-D-manno-octulosonic acid transferase [Gammaproteobacteria bacterium]
MIDRMHAATLHVLYNALLIIALPVIWIRLVFKGRMERRSERFGRLPESIPKGAVWFHTVSAGETIAAAPLIRELAISCPEISFLVTTMTPTGSEQVENLLGDVVDHAYAPYDFPWAVARFLDRAEPKALVLMETELWPNLIAQCAERNIPALLVNARLSERSARGYRRVASLTRDMLEKLDLIICQYDDSKQRFLDLGAPAEVVEVAGSVKFDLTLPAESGATIEKLKATWVGSRLAWIAASTHQGEDEIVLRAHQTLRSTFRDLLLVLVPRHPERFDDVANLSGSRGFTTGRLSQAPGQQVDVLVGDTMGQLIDLYGIADVAFIGGSLVPHGGHNPIEAAVHGKAMLMGPHRFNFEEIAGRFADAGCLHTVNGANTLADAVRALLGDEPRRSREGAQAKMVVSANAGARSRLHRRLQALLAG